jgi:hypothetical protein
VTTELPLAVPAVFGANETEMFTAFCGAKVTGRVGPTKLKPVPKTKTCETVKLNLLVLVMATDLMEVLPKGTVPKLMLVEDAVCPRALEISAISARRKHQQAGLKGELGQVIIILIRCPSTCHAGGQGISISFRRSDKPIAQLRG